jgi:hypothetical protein
LGNFTTKSDKKQPISHPPEVLTSLAASARADYGRQPGSRAELCLQGEALSVSGERCLAAEPAGGSKIHRLSMA